MSRRKKNNPFLFQNLIGKSIKYTRAELKIINGLKPLVGGEWDGAIKAASTVRRIDRDMVKTNIKKKLLKIQGPYCIYCGLHEKHCGELEREHIAPKGIHSYPTFMFEPENLCLACHHCNFDLKEEFNTISHRSISYSKNKFNIIHPYLDDLNLHIEFVVEEGKVLIRKRPRSRKGKKTIELFELDTPENTEKRSGLLIVKELNFKRKYDLILEAALNRKYVKI